jgi:hypothetical protein
LISRVFDLAGPADCDPREFQKKTWLKGELVPNSEFLMPIASTGFAKPQKRKEMNYEVNQPKSAAVPWSRL